MMMMANSSALVSRPHIPGVSASNHGELDAPILGGSSELTTSCVFGLTADALAQIFSTSSGLPPGSEGSRVVVDHHSTSNSPPSTNSFSTVTASQMSLPGSETYQTSQMFKSVPDGGFSFYPAPVRQEDQDIHRAHTAMMPADYTRFLNAHAQKNSQVGLQSRPSAQGVPSLSLGGTHPSVTLTAGGSIPMRAAQGVLDDDSARDSEDDSPRGRAYDALPDDKTAKKRRRQEKNREAAQLFRQRQKAKVHELERSVEALTKNNSELRMKMEILVGENRSLKEQLGFLKHLVTSGIVISGAPTTTFPPALPPVHTDATSLTPNMLAPGGGGSSPIHTPPLSENNTSPLGSPPTHTVPTTLIHPHPTTVLMNTPANGPLRPTPVPKLTPINNTGLQAPLDENHIVRL